MRKVTRKKLWQGWILFALSGNVIGVGLAMFIHSHWIALSHLSLAITMLFIYLETLEQGKEDSDDEQ